MARLTYGQKAQRLLVFLLALRHPQIATALAKYRFDDAELATGWALLSAMSKLRLDLVPTTDPKLLAELDAWENTWFPVIAAVLQYASPQAYEFVFRNLSQESGPAVVITVRALCERVRMLPLPKAEGGLGREGKAARDLLERRGLTEAELQSPERILELISKIQPTPLPARDLEAEEAAERAMWAWYLQWSAIARVAVKDRRLLKLMGYRKTATGQITEPEPPSDDDTEEDEDDADVDPVTPEPAEDVDPAPSPTT